MGNGVTVARLALNQLVQVRILVPQFFTSRAGGLAQAEAGLVRWAGAGGSVTGLGGWRKRNRGWFGGLAQAEA